MRIQQSKVPISIAGCVAALLMALGIVAFHQKSPSMLATAGNVIGPSISSSAETKRSVTPISGGDASAPQAETDGFEQFRAALQNGDATIREQSLRRIGYILASKDPGLAQKAYAALIRGGDRRAFLNGMMEIWATVDSEAAMSFLQGLPPSTYKPMIAYQALGALARKDARRALDWLPRLVSGIHRDNAALNIVATLATYDLESALNYANAQPSAQARAAFAEMAVAEAAGENPIRARETVESRKDLTPEARQSALNAIAGVWAAEAGQNAVDWAEQIFSQTGSRRPLEVALINWATADAPSAAAALYRHLSEDWSAKVVQKVAGFWADQEPEAAASWVSSLPDSAARDAAMEGFVSAWSENDPIAALKWTIALHQDDPVRDYSMLQAASALRESEQAAFDAFVKTLPPVQQVRLQELMEEVPAARTALFTN